jgi:hypothetical protein
MAGNEEGTGADVDVVFSERDDGQEGDGSKLRRWGLANILPLVCCSAAAPSSDDQGPRVCALLAELRSLTTALLAAGWGRLLAAAQLTWSGPVPLRGGERCCWLLRQIRINVLLQASCYEMGLAAALLLLAGRPAGRERPCWGGTIDIQPLSPPGRGSRRAQPFDAPCLCVLREASPNNGRVYS